jgi:hypothetical protein
MSCQLKLLEIVRLSSADQQKLADIVKSGRPHSRRVILAMALIWLDCSQKGPGLSDSYVANTLGLSMESVNDLKRLYNQGGPDLAINNYSADGTICSNRNKIDLSFEEKLIALANSEAPKGRGRWSVRLLAEKATELKLINSVSHMTIHRLLKKHNCNLESNQN